MTREEEILRAYNEQKTKLGNQEHTFMRGAKWADEHPHWISVEDEMPRDGQHTATINKAGFQAVRYYKGGKWFSSYGNEYGDITHWMPLPQPPKKGGEK